MVYANPSDAKHIRFRAGLRTCITLLFWYSLSTSIILISKWLFNGLFTCPLTVTTFSNTLTSLWAFLLSRRPAWKPEPLTRKQFKEYVLPIGITTALEIGFSNIALKLLTVSFGTILKGGAPIFTMMWGLVLGIESFSANLFGSLFTIGLGIALASLGERHSFAFNGFILQLLATALGGLRWAMTHMYLRGNTDNTGSHSSKVLSPLTATLYTSPTTALCVLPFAFILEGSDVYKQVSEADSAQLWTIFGTMTLIGTLVFVLLISEYWLVNATSSLALSVAGVFKELLTILGGIILFKERMSPLNNIGFFVCQVGIFGYVYLRYEPSSTETPIEISQHEIPLTAAELSDEETLEV